MKLFIKVKTKAKNATVKKIDEIHYLVSVTASPVKGKANEAIIEILAKHFEVSKSKILITVGEKSREKIIEII